MQTSYTAKPVPVATGDRLLKDDLREGIASPNTPASSTTQAMPGRAMTDSQNIRRFPRGPADPKAAARAKRYRDGKRAKRDAAAESAASRPAEVAVDPHHGITASLVPTVTVPPRRDGGFVTLFAAFGIAGVSAFFSITGLTHIFAGAPAPVFALGCMLEASKLCAVRWLGGGDGSPLLRTVMLILVMILIMLSALGTFGFLSAAHIARVTADETAINEHAAQADADITVQADAVADLDQQVSLIDDTIRAATLRGRTQSALTMIGGQSRTRAGLAARRQAAAEKLAELKVRRASVDGERRAVQADLGPVKYLAAVIGASDEQAMRGFILIVSILLDPLACALLIAATTRSRS